MVTILTIFMCFFLLILFKKNISVSPFRSGFKVLSILTFNLRIFAQCFTQNRKKVLTTFLLLNFNQSGYLNCIYVYKTILKCQKWNSSDVSKSQRELMLLSQKMNQVSDSWEPLVFLHFR